MNRKGFTLVELLATIALIAVIMLLFMPTIGDLVSEFQTDDKVEMLKNSAIMAAKEYVTDGKANTNNLNDIKVYLSELHKNKYLDYDEFYDGDYIQVRYDSTAKKFTDYTYKTNNSDKVNIKACKEDLEKDTYSPDYTCNKNSVTYKIKSSKPGNKITYHYIEKRT